MKDLTLILLAAGSSTRFENSVKKQWLRIAEEPLWSFVTDNFDKTQLFENIIITAHPDEVTFMHNYTSAKVIEGGQTRQQSLKNALSYVKTKHVLISDIARCCIDIELINSLIQNRDKAECIVPFLKANDTIVYEDETIDRSNIKRIQTPQLSLTSALIKSLHTKEEFTDESSAIVAAGFKRYFIQGCEDAHKITYIQDLKHIKCLRAPSNTTLVGNGFDVHEFEDNKEMFLGGVKIESDFGFKAHSDGDVAIHSLIDALLGAAGMGDIGMLFPDNDNRYKGIDSKELLALTVLKLHQFGFIINNADITIVAETPRLANYKDEIRKVLSKILKIKPIKLNIKATTTEKLGFVGRKEGVAVMSNATLNYYNWMEN
ncbi:MAG: bifunctional 2-C-methyl-D-erythritol 4-phosphate cytidylyltransferase/2-C-methyl-D-erythritol 2,4-cyclodiphosphate synthase [Helicobacteraceae bacterium]|nr:bifunctional 2-C-methyl-D-erythritol 4-phosphate cytidylyltransferase/2-C-methyl-D-erythritol 2,4-cyclodiphosphate synthase [Helicobacteraceae bacterium]